MLKPEEVKPYSAEDGKKIKEFEEKIDAELQEQHGRARVLIKNADNAALNHIAAMYTEAGWDVRVINKDDMLTTKATDRWLEIKHPMLVKRTVALSSGRSE